jgi:hypothetical protein
VTTPQGALTSSGLLVLDQGDRRSGRIVSTVLITKRPQFDSLHPGEATRMDLICVDHRTGGQRS